MMDTTIEEHPFKPFLPANASMLMLGTFPPARKRWSMEFYYPNYQNDMWRIVGLCFFNDKRHFLREDEKTFNLKAIKAFLIDKGIALFDTATKVRRTKNTASDKDLDIVEATDLDSMLNALPHCRMVVTAGQLATSVFCRHFAIAEPKVGCFTEFLLGDHAMRIYRMPSSSRAYPMSVERKAEYYEKVFGQLPQCEGQSVQVCHNT